MKTYKIKKTDSSLSLDGQWSGEYWAQVPHLDIALFHPKSSSHHPKTEAKLSYDTDTIRGIFKVEDQYIRSTTTRLQDSVCRDSCVEFFFKPAVGKGYFNFEFNCGGNMLCHYVINPERDTNGQIENFKVIDINLAEKVNIFHSLPKLVDPEITIPTTWFLEFQIPFSILEEYCGPIENISGTEWRANLYKCGDKTSHPHWASWAPITKLNFHLPECFIPVLFE